MSDLGHLSLYITLCTMICIAFTPLIELCCFKVSYLVLKLAWLVACFFALLSLLCLIYCYVVSDFSVLNVLNNSHSSKPLIYKITGAWSNHEGSMLLWVSAISFFAALSGFLIQNEALGKLTLIVQAYLSCFFVAFTIFVSNPFLRIFLGPVNGLGLNPVLQDIGLALHPPMLYLGYVGFSAGYSATIAALIQGCIGREWALIVRTCTTLSWFFLTIGIALGSWWAYRELGWGGFWFWDPVENASLMPWLSATALLHAVQAYYKTGHMRQWSIILALMTFVLSVIGMFLVRSGIVTSVHAFAIDPSRGLVILAFLAILAIASLLIYFFCREAPTEAAQPFSLYSRIFCLIINNILLTTAVFTIVVGTLYPILLEALTERNVAVGASYFNKIFSPLMLALAGLCAVGSELKWYQDAPRRKHILVFGIAALLAAFLSFYIELRGLAEIFGVVFGFFLILQCLLSLYRSRKSRVAIAATLGHLGFGIIVVAIAINVGLQVEIEKSIKVGETINFSNYNITLANVFEEKRSNHIAQIATLIVTDKHSKIFLRPEIRFFPIENQQTIEAAIHREIFRDLYVVIDRAYGAEGTVIRIFNRPMMGWLWFGAALIALAGMYALLLRFRSIFMKQT